jgi:hypothetical protein
VDEERDILLIEKKKKKTLISTATEAKCNAAYLVLR